jgi:NAD(P)-dependent dehydrogenase (short-subunit alcohol dehydrogenase family)
LKKRGMEELKSRGEKPTPAKVQSIVKAVLANREISRTLEAIRGAGGEAEYVSADVTDPELCRKVAPVVKRLGPITGVVHGAGVLADKLIEQKTLADFESVYSTKVRGLESLLRCVDPGTLRHLALFSSAAAFFGNPGQSDYAMANEILNKAAYQLQEKYPQCRVTAFNWGPWDGGMVNDSLKKMFAERDIKVIPIQAGTKVFVRELASSEKCATQILIGSSMRVDGEGRSPEPGACRIIRRLSARANPFLEDHVIGGAPVLPSVCLIAWMADACERLQPGYRFFRCEDFRIRKGIVLDEPLSEYVLEARRTQQEDSEGIEFDVLISSLKPGGRPGPRSSGRILLLRKIPEAPVYPHFESPPEAHGEDGARLYEDGTLFHGPRFHLVERIVNSSRRKLTLSFRTREIPEQDQGQFPIGNFNPYAADVHFQSMLIWVRQYHQAGSLPSRAGAVEQYRPIPAGRRLFVSLDVKTETKTKLVADVTTHDESGTIYMRVKDGEVTISEKLNRLFRSGS